MRAKQDKPNEPFDTSRLDFLMSVDKLLRAADETKRLRDKLLERAESNQQPEEVARG